MVAVTNRRQRLDQPGGIRVSRRVQDVIGRAGLDDGPRIHHCHAGAYLLHDAVIVRNQKYGQSEIAGQILEQAEDLRLRAHVECAGRLIGHEEPRLRGYCHRDHDSLALATGQFRRVGVKPTARTAQTATLQHFHGLRTGHRA